MVRLMCLLVLTETAFLTGTESLYIPETNAVSYYDFNARAQAQ